MWSWPALRLKRPARNAEIAVAVLAEVIAALRRRIFVVRRADRALSSAAQGLYELLMAHRPDR